MTVVRNVPDQVTEFNPSSDFVLQNSSFNNKYALPPLSNTKVLYKNVPAVSIKAVCSSPFSAQLQYTALPGSAVSGTVTKDITNINQSIPQGVDGFAVLLKNQQNTKIDCELQLQTGVPSSKSKASLAWYIIVFAIVLPVVVVLLLLICLCVCCCNRNKDSDNHQQPPNRVKKEDLNLYPHSEQMRSSTGHQESEQFYKPDANNPYYVPPIAQTDLDLTNEDIKLHHFGEKINL